MAQRDSNASVHRDSVGALPDCESLAALLPTDIRAQLDKLTRKQRAFAILVGYGTEKTQAYRQAYDVGVDTLEGSVAAMTNRVARHRKVAAATDAVRKAVSAQTDAATGAIVPASTALRPEDVPLSREWVLARLGEEAENKRNAGSVKVRALELIGKTQGMFQDVQVVRDERPKSVEEVDKRIMAILGELATGRRSLPSHGSTEPGTEAGPGNGTAKALPPAPLTGDGADDGTEDGAG